MKLKAEMGTVSLFVVSAAWQLVSMCASHPANVAFVPWKSLNLYRNDIVCLSET